ncbi:hypothetical protein [Kamptonema formosum]|uniref:hypothetical protein n=1 Tax=Kamptonema formosum TaxID=331992 RepID=UPI0012DED09C|nr:hypothetical protein [Oscillatoria sp. PCC 10802]
MWELTPPSACPFVGGATARRHRRANRPKAVPATADSKSPPLALRVGPGDLPIPEAPAFCDEAAGLPTVFAAAL